ncbi:MAG: hypothetical protein WCI17_10060 [bacterium]
MQRMIVLAAATLAVALLGSGCQTYTSQAKTMHHEWSAGNAAVAAAAFGKEADASGDSKDAVVWNLEAGTVYRAAGNLPESNRHFGKAAERIDVYEQQAKTKVGREALALMSNEQNMPYEGRSYDKIMLHTYQALNFLAQGDSDKARPEIIRAYQYQQDAVEENARRIERAQEEEKKSKDKAAIDKARSDPKFSGELAGVTNNLEGFRFYADYVNPFTVYLDGLYFLHAGAGGSDLEHARKSLQRVQETSGTNKFIQADLQAAESGTPSAACTYVIFETGEAASLDQVRIDVPIILFKVSYVGVAFPRLAFHDNYARELTVTAGAVQERTTLIASMDAVIAQDFRNEWPAVLTKAIASAVAKGVAAYVVNSAAERQSEVAGWISKVGTAVAQMAVNIADTRSWTTLPKEYQVACVPTPADRKLVLAAPGQAPVEVALVDGTVNVVCVRSVTSGSPLQVSQFKLK